MWLTGLLQLYGTILVTVIASLYKVIYEFAIKEYNKFMCLIQNNILTIIASLYKLKYIFMGLIIVSADF